MGGDEIKKSNPAIRESGIFLATLIYIGSK